MLAGLLQCVVVIFSHYNCHYALTFGRSFTCLYIRIAKNKRKAKHTAFFCFFTLVLQNKKYMHNYCKYGK